MAIPFTRTLSTPRSGLILITSYDTDDFERANHDPEGPLAHGLGWTAELRRDAVLLINPLGEGAVRAPGITDASEWLDEIRHSGSVALYVVSTRVTETERGRGDAADILHAAQLLGPFPAATIRAAVDPDIDAPPVVGRNEPCYCGSGRKFKHCHGR